MKPIRFWKNEKKEQQRIIKLFPSIPITYDYFFLLKISSISRIINLVNVFMNHEFSNHDNGSPTADIENKHIENTKTHIASKLGQLLASNQHFPCFLFSSYSWNLTFLTDEFHFMHRCKRKVGNGSLDCQSSYACVARLSQIMTNKYMKRHNVDTCSNLFVNDISPIFCRQ